MHLSSVSGNLCRASCDAGIGWRFRPSEERGLHESRMEMTPWLSQQASRPGGGRSDWVSRKSKLRLIISVQSSSNYLLCIFSAEGSSGFRQGSESGFQGKVRKCHLCKLKLIKSNMKLKQLAICRRKPPFGNVLHVSLGCALNLHLRMDTPEVFRGVQEQ